MQDELTGQIPVEDEEGQGTDGDAIPPYISFLSFLHHVEWLEGEGIPHRFDRSFWSRKYSGSMGPQLISGLRFLRLLEDDLPQPILDKLVQAKGDDRKSVLTEVLKRAYTQVQFDLLARATPGMLTDWLSHYRAEGDTKRKVESFFVNALKYVDYPISPAIKKMARNRPSKSPGSGGNRTRGQKSTGNPDTKGQEEQRPPPPRQRNEQQGNDRIVTLVSGGQVALTLDVDLFTLSPADREWVLGLVDHVQSYDGDLLDEGSEDGEEDYS